MRPTLTTFALALLACSCSTVTLTVAADDGSATTENEPVVRKRPADEGNPFSASRDGDGEREHEEHEEHDDDAEEDSRIIDVLGPLRLEIPRGRSHRLMLRRSDDGRYIIAPARREAPRIL